MSIILWVGTAVFAATPKPQVADSTPTREELILEGRKKASYRAIFAGYQPSFELEPFFKFDPTSGVLPPPPAIESLRAEWGDRASLRFSVLQAVVESQDSMVRTEIEEEATAKGARLLLEISLLRLRAMGPEQSAVWLSSEGEVWQRLLQGLPFEEASAKTLMFASELRALIWQEMLAKIKAAPQSLPQASTFPWAAWAERVNGVRLAWPIDRVLLAEARKSLPPAAMVVTTHIAFELQKSAHKSVAEIRKGIKGGAMTRLDILDAVWSPLEVKRMESEMDQLEEIRLRLGLQRFRVLKNAEPKNLDELVANGLVDRIPLCYQTQKLWQLSQILRSAPAK